MNKENFHILVVEDEFINQEFLRKVLVSLGFINIYVATNADDTLDIIKDHKIDVIFMDINLDGPIDGITCAKIVNQTYKIPIIYTTAYSDTDTLIEANDTNICGYLIKPFDKKDIEANLYIALKKHHDFTLKEKKNSSTVSILGNCKFDMDKSELFINNKIQDLTNKEKDILYLLCKNIDSNVTYEKFKEYIWEDKEVAISTIRDIIFRLRKKIPKLNIKSVSGTGYSLRRELDV